MMRTCFQTQAAAFRTSERRLLAFANNTPPYNSAAMGEVPETIDDIKENDKPRFEQFKQKILILLKSAGEDAQIVKACRAEVLALIQTDDYWEALPERDKLNILNAFPKKKIDFLEFAVDNNFLEAVPADELKELWAQRPEHVHTYADTVTKVTYLPDGMKMETFEELVQRWERVKMDYAKTFKPYKKTPPDVLEARAQATAAQLEMQNELMQKLGADWSVRIAEYKSTKTLDRRAQIQKKEAIGRKEDELRGIKRGGLNLEPDEEVVGGIRRKKPRPRADITPAQREASIMRQGDFVDNSPRYEVKHNPKLKRLRYDSQTGSYVDYTAEFNQWEDEQTGRAPTGAIRPVTSRKAMFGPGRVSSKGHDDLVRQSTSHLDKGVQNKLRTESADRAYQRFVQDINALEKEFPNARQAQSYTVLEDYVDRLEYQKAIDQISIIRRELKQMNALTALGDTVGLTAKSLEVEDSPYFTVNVKNMLTGKTYSFKPQLVLSTNKASNDAAIVRDLYASEGVRIRFDRMGDRITDSNQRKVNSIAIDLTNPDSKYFTVTTSSRNNNNALELGNPALKPVPYDTGAPENEPVGKSRKVTLDFSKGIPEGLSIINKTKRSKNGNADSFTRSQLEGLASGDSLTGSVAGVTIRKEGDSYTMSLENGSQYSVRERRAGANTDYRDISNAIPGLNAAIPVPRSISQQHVPGSNDGIPGTRTTPMAFPAEPSVQEQPEAGEMRSYIVTPGDAIPFGLSITNRTSKASKIFLPDNLKNLAVGDSLADDTVGVTITNTGEGHYRLSVKKGSQYSIQSIHQSYLSLRTVDISDRFSQKLTENFNAMPAQPLRQNAAIQNQSSQTTRSESLPPQQRAPETVQNGPTQQEFTTQRDEIITKTNALLGRMNTYKGKEWTDYTNRFRSNIQLRTLNYDPQNRLMTNGRRMNEWNLEQLKKTFDAYAPSAETRMNEWDAQNAAKSLPPDFPETAVERPEPAASPAANPRPKTNVEKINEITDSLPAVTRTPSATPAPQSNADAINEITDSLPTVAQKPAEAPVTTPQTPEKQPDTLSSSVEIQDGFRLAEGVTLHKNAENKWEIKIDGSIWEGKPVISRNSVTGVSQTGTSPAPDTFTIADDPIPLFYQENITADAAEFFAQKDGVPFDEKTQLSYILYENKDGKKVSAVHFYKTDSSLIFAQSAGHPVVGVFSWEKRKGAAPAVQSNADAINNIANNLGNSSDAQPNPVAEVAEADEMTEIDKEFTSLFNEAAVEVTRLQSEKYANIKDVAGLMDTLKDAKNSAQTATDKKEVIDVLRDALRDMKKAKGNTK